MSMTSGGVTSTSINLAIGLTKTGHRVTLRSYVDDISSQQNVKPPILGPVLKLVFNVQFEDMVNAVA